MKKFHAVENRIWKYRNARGLKQTELAFLIGHENAAQVSRYERGLVLPKLEQLFKLCCALDIRVESLYPGLVEEWRREVETRHDKQTVKIHDAKKQVN